LNKYSNLIILAPILAGLCFWRVSAYFEGVYGSVMLLLLVLLVICISMVCGAFFYCQALVTGFGRKRWTVAGVVFGPLIWPMFTMKKRMRLNRLFGFEQLIFNA